MIGFAEDIIDRMSGEFEPDKFEDRYQNAMIELIRSTQAGLPASKEKAAARPANVVNRMDALRRSVEDSRGQKSKTPAVPCTALKRMLGFRALLIADLRSFEVWNTQGTLANRAIGVGLCGADHHRSFQ